MWPRVRKLCRFWLVIISLLLVTGIYLIWPGSEDAKRRNDSDRQDYVSLRFMSFTFYHTPYKRAPPLPITHVEFLM